MNQTSLSFKWTWIYLRFVLHWSKMTLILYLLAKCQMSSEPRGPTLTELTYLYLHENRIKKFFKRWFGNVLKCYFHSNCRKKSLTVDNKSTQRLKKRGGSPLVVRKSNEQNLTGSSTSTSGSTSRLRALQTEGAGLSISAASDGHSDSEAVSTYNKVVIGCSFISF